MKQVLELLRTELMFENIVLGVYVFIGSILACTSIRLCMSFVVIPLKLIHLPALIYSYVYWILCSVIVLIFYSYFLYNKKIIPSIAVILGYIVVIIIPSVMLEGMN